MKLLTQWAFTSSALILIVLAVRVLFRNKLSARLRYALWGVVLLRLLIPFQVELPASVSDSVPLLVSNAVPEVGQWEKRTIPVFPERSKPVAEFDLDIETTLEPGDILSYSDKAGCQQRSADGETIIWYRYLLSPEQIVLALWLAGAVLTGTVILLSNLRFTLRLRKRRERLEDIDSPVPVYTAEGLPSPCLFGVLRPAVYVTPQAAEDPDTLRHVLAHELTHHAHKDHLWSLLRCLALALHWYDSLVWLAVVLSKGDGELACDEGAVARLGEAERIPYGRTLVDMVAARSLRPADLLSYSTAMTGGGKSVKQRVAQLVKKPETVKIALFAAVALVALAVVFTFAGRKDEPASPELDRFFAELESAQRIGIGNPLMSSAFEPGNISAPEALAQAKELLSKTTPVAYLEDVGWDVLSLDSNHPPEYITQEELESQFLIGGHPLNLFSTLDNDIETAHRCWLVWTEDCVLLTQWFPEREENTVEILAALPADTIIKLKELARTNGTSQPAGPASPELEAFLADLDSASSIRYCPPLYSSYFYRETITDPRLLANVRERLSYLVPLEAEDATPDGKQLLDASRLVLTTEAGEVTYNLIPYNGYTYVTRGSGDYSVQENGRTAYLRTRTQTNLSGSISALARTQELLSQDPLTPVPMTRAELGGYSLADICETLGYQLQGWGGDPEDAELVSGHTMQDRVLLCYNGDETHEGSWVLELLAPGVSSHSSGFTVQSDQPEVVRNAALYRLSGSGWKNFEVMTPDIFAVCLRPEDVVSVTAGDYDPGQEVTVDIPALREQLTQSLYHQFSSEYDREKHGQYVLTIRVQGSGREAYSGREIAEDADRLTLSAGSEKDVVCLSHRNFAATPEPTRLFVRSPELYRTIRDLFD